MFWRFGFHNPSAIDTLLDSGEDIDLEELLDQEDFLQEAKGRNQKLVEFLCNHDNLTKILYYITATDIEDNQKLKYPFLCSEVIASEIPQIIDTIVIEKPELLESFWTYLDRPIVDDEQGTDALLASYFCKAMTVFLAKRTKEVLEFIKSKPENLQNILARLKTSAFMDLLLTLVRMEELPEGKGVVQWLSDLHLLENLLDRLHPELDTEEHSIAQQCICEIIRMSQTSLPESPTLGCNDLIVKLKSVTVMEKLAGFMLDAKAPNATSTLINGVAIIIDLIRHNNSDVDNDPSMTNAYGYPGNPSARETPVSLADMLNVLAKHVGEFNELLINPRPTNTAARSSSAEHPPLGFERLKICELFAELLHCSNMSNLNTVTDEATDEMQQGQASLNLPADTCESENAIEQNVSKDNKEIEPNEPKNPSESIELNEPESKLPIGDYLKAQLVHHKVLPTCTQLFFANPWNNFLHYVVYDMLHQVFNGRMDKGYNRHLAISVLKDGKLMSNIMNAQKKNDEECAKTKGTRLGYMGHITFISDEIIKLFEGYRDLIVTEIEDDVDLQLWTRYCDEELKETKERDRLPLGGSLPKNEGSASEEEEISQSSYHIQSEEDEEEDDHWITGSDDVGRDYGVSGVSNAIDDEEYGSDEEEDAGQVVTHDWTRRKEFSSFPLTNALHRTQSRVREDDEDEDGEEYDDHADPTELERRASLRNAGNTQDEIQDEADGSVGELIGTKDYQAEAAVVDKLGHLHFGDSKSDSEEGFVRAIKTKEEQSKHIQEYRPEDEQEGEI